MEEIIWTPQLYSGKDFNIYLDPNFAKKALDFKVSTVQQDKINELGETNLNQFTRHGVIPYSFHENSLLLSQVVFNGGAGVWLSLEYSIIKSLVEKSSDLETVRYSSHNVGNSKEVHGILKLFSDWVEYVNAFLED